MGGGEREYPLAVEKGERVGDHEDSVRPLALHRRKCLLEIVGLAPAERPDAEAHRLRARLRLLVPQHHAVGRLFGAGGDFPGISVRVCPRGRASRCGQNGHRAMTRVLGASLAFRTLRVCTPTLVS